MCGCLWRAWKTCFRAKFGQRCNLRVGQSQRRKDLLDIERLLEAYPQLQDRVPEEILQKLN